MANNLFRYCLFALALIVGLSAAPALAQELNSMYVTPKIIYSKKTADMSKAHWENGIWTTGVLGGEDKDDGFGFGLAFGNDFSFSTAYPIRLEAEYLYHGEGNFSKGPSIIENGARRASQSFKIKAHSLMVNGFYDINIDSVITPYVGGGLGLSYLKSTSSSRVTNGASGRISTSSNDWGFAWNIGGGITYALDNQMALDFGYRYFDLGTAEPGSVRQAGVFNGSREVDLTAHEFSVGLRFSGF